MILCVWILSIYGKSINQSITSKFRIHLISTHLMNRNQFTGLQASHNLLLSHKAFEKKRPQSIHDCYNDNVTVQLKGWPTYGEKNKEIKIHNDRPLSQLNNALSIGTCDELVEIMSQSPYCTSIDPENLINCSKNKVPRRLKKQAMIAKGMWILRKKRV